MDDYQVWDSDDMGCTHVISDMCQSRDCRGELLKLKEANSNFKITLFAIPGEMTPELLWWAAGNDDWVELAMHGFFHYSNYECEKMSFGDFEMMFYQPSLSAMIKKFVKVFKAPGWQISDDIYRWLLENEWRVADQAYNDGRRPKELPVYKVGKNSVHTHTWSCMGNGIDETLPQLLEKVKQTNDFRFVSEVVK